MMYLMGRAFIIVAIPVFLWGLTGTIVFVVPNFEVIFQDFDTDLPQLTTGLIAVSHFLGGDTGSGRWLLFLGVYTPLCVLLGALLLRHVQRWSGVTVAILYPLIGLVGASCTALIVIALFLPLLGTILVVSAPPEVQDTTHITSPGAPATLPEALPDPDRTRSRPVEPSHESGPNH